MHLLLSREALISSVLIAQRNSVLREIARRTGTLQRRAVTADREMKREASFHGGVGSLGSFERISSMSDKLSSSLGSLQYGLDALGRGDR